MKLSEVLRAKVKTDEYSMRQLQRLLEGLEAVKKGDLTVRLRKNRGRVQYTINKIFSVKCSTTRTFFTRICIKTSKNRKSESEKV